MPPADTTDGRRARSERTRAAIIAGATRRFLAQGYVGSTIEDVAREAKVAVQTVYYVFGTKPKLLAAVLDASIAGDASAGAVLDRPWVEHLRAAPDAHTAVRLLVDAAVEIVARAAPIYEVVRRASADPDVAALLEETRHRRRLDQRRLAAILAEAGHLDPAVDANDAADVLYGLLNEELVGLLVHDCDWSTAKLRAWLTEVLVNQLLLHASTTT
jgi:AcrR family transcriptional regulator